MKRLPLLICVLIASMSSCTDEIPTTPEPVDYYRWITAQPDMMPYAITDTYEWRPHGGDGYILTPDSLIFIGEPNRYAWPIDTMLSNGNQLYFHTTNVKHRYRGTIMPDGFDGYMITKADNGKPGPAYSHYFKRVQ